MQIRKSLSMCGGECCGCHDRIKEAETGSRHECCGCKEKTKPTSHKNHPAPQDSFKKTEQKNSSPKAKKSLGRKIKNCASAAVEIGSGTLCGAIGGVTKGVPYSFLGAIASMVAMAACPPLGGLMLLTSLFAPVTVGTVCGTMAGIDSVWHGHHIDQQGMDSRWDIFS